MSLTSLPIVQTVSVDMCEHGLRVRLRDGSISGLVRHASTIVTNVPEIAEAIQRRCSGLHKHHVLEGSFQTQQAAKYSDGFVDSILRGLKKFFKKNDCDSHRDVASYHMEHREEVKTPLEKDLLKLGQMVADPVIMVMRDYIQKMEQMGYDLEIWEQANELLFSGEVEPTEYFNEFTAFPLSRERLKPVIPEEFQYDQSRDQDPRSTNLDDLDDETKMPRGQYDKLHKKHHEKIMADARAEYHSLPKEMRQEVMRLHRALAHLPRLDLARILMDAGAKEEIVQWTKRHFRCPVCDSKVKPGAQRLSSAKRVWQFNKVVGLDHIHPKFQNTTYDFLNMLCWGTSRQVVVHAEDGPTAVGTRRRVAVHWVQPFGLMEVLVVDQGPEFTGAEFRTFWMRHGVLVHFTDSRSPWQMEPQKEQGASSKKYWRKWYATNAS